MRPPHCPGSGFAAIAVVADKTDPRCGTGLCPRCRRWVRLTWRDTLNHHVGTLRTTAKLRDDARGAR
jgi:hypothetical protein